MASSKQINSNSYAPAPVPIYGDDENPLAETVSPDAQLYLEVVAPATLPEVSIAGQENDKPKESTPLEPWRARMFCK